MALLLFGLQVLLKQGSWWFNEVLRLWTISLGLAFYPKICDTANPDVGRADSLKSGYVTTLVNDEAFIGIVVKKRSKQEYEAAVNS